VIVSFRISFDSRLSVDLDRSLFDHDSRISDVEHRGCEGRLTRVGGDQSLELLLIDLHERIDHLGGDRDRILRELEAHGVE